MIEINAHKFLISSLYTLYCALVLWFLNPLVTVGIEPHWSISLTVLLLIFGIIFGTLFAANKIKNKGAKQLIVLLGFALTPTISAVCTVIFSPTDFKAITHVTLSSLIIAIPLVAILLLWIIYDDIKNKIKVSGNPTKENTNLKLTSDKGKTLIDVSIDSILCFEANDNYVVFYHLDDSNKVQKSMQRISLKKVEELLEELDVQFKRVHKSYLVNPTQIENITGKAQAYRVQLKHFYKEIPVSRNFKISDITG